ncbi:hypothetical protein [Saccharothrix syringae]|nr:hypothetical protein [Saccharothrix syringae]
MTTSPGRRRFPAALSTVAGPAALAQVPADRAAPRSLFGAGEWTLNNPG